MKIRATIASGLTLILAVGLLQFTAAPQKAEAAAVASQFNPGMIISDALFYDGGAMSASAVQNFLNSQVRACAAGATCLKDFRQDTASRPAVAGRCAAYPGAGNESAAEIIAKVGAVCGISQKALIVLLQKEQGLVTATSPSAGKYQIATGYACPDTAACDSQYFGFFNQVYSAASQFKRYSTLPSAFNHVAGRVNNVRLHPNAACGSTPVLIQNAATAGLYNYTPYQPNASAMANLYGTGDACASYGNRNFWRYYTDWFGSTTVSSLLRTVDSALVYLVSGGVKYPVRTPEIYNAYSALGAASMVSQTYLDSLTTLHDAKRIIRAPGGAIYFIDSAIKTQFDSCDMVADYGGSCNNDGYVNLTDGQVAAFHTGPLATQVLGTREGARYYLDNGTKREVLDNASQTAAGLGLGFNVLTEGAVSALPYGAPLVRDSVVVTSREGGGYNLLANGVRYPLSTATASVSGLAQRWSGALHDGSLGFISAAPTAFDNTVRIGGAAEMHLLTDGGKYSVSQSSIVSASRPTTIAGELGNSYATVGTLADGSFVKASDAATVYMLTPTGARSISAWPTLVALAKRPDPTILTLAPEVVAAIPKGSPTLAPGLMYRTAGDPGIYIVDGASNRLHVGSFEYTTAAGFLGWSYANQAELDTYAVTPGGYSTFGVVCNGAKYVAAGGSLHAVSEEKAGLFPFTWTPLAAETCGRTTIGSPATDFIRVDSGEIYLLSGGQKLYISAQRLGAVMGANTWLQVPNGFAAAIPNGPAA